MEQNITNTENTEQQNATNENTQRTPEEIFEKFNSMVESRLSRIEKSMAKDSGLSDDAEEFLTSYKAWKESTKNSKVSDLEKKVDELTAQNKELKDSAYNVSFQSYFNSTIESLGADKTYAKQIQKLTDKTGVRNDDGSVNTEKLEAAVKAVLDETPIFLKKQEQDEQQQVHINVGSKQQKDSETTDDFSKMVRRAAGLTD